MPDEQFCECGSPSASRSCSPSPLGTSLRRAAIARSVILPALDILQSVPVLGFLSITVTGFMALFPGSLLGVECASIFAIFTGQVWNMTFGFYHSLVTIPKDLQEAATNFRLSPLAAVRNARSAFIDA